LLHAWPPHSAAGTDFFLPVARSAPRKMPDQAFAASLATSCLEPRKTGTWLPPCWQAGARRCLSATGAWGPLTDDEVHSASTCLACRAINVWHACDRCQRWIEPLWRLSWACHSTDAAGNYPELKPRKRTNRCRSPRLGRPQCSLMIARLFRSQ
jgi:hypothetical protein